ncbi:uracil-DNA glycosylase, family 4 [Tangfeifania diversioriginum]|uniref:Uracil-DNA glycosylase, family 4 n=1 Tax=Tangfeifania diversioriginum TaxID=1168035 RepID=A0A1M6HFN3_9BACT|nr:uracil-DNA glycosylase family protein [Tangfeifania diversioriginum]SHJ20953.1 uracil-DNA glycosylase, family 4 [Tangfeifania diversioriginum]
MRKSEYALYDNLFPDIQNSISFGNTCSLCSEKLSFTGEDIIWGNGPKDATIMVIGKDSAGGNINESLWKGSRITRIPLTNKKSGAKIRIMFHKLGVNPHRIYFTNTVKCNTGYLNENNFSYNTLVNNCIQHLSREIKIIKPRMIICLGRSVHRLVYKHIESCFNNYELDKCRYLEHPSRVEGIKRESVYIQKLHDLLM